MPPKHTVFQHNVVNCPLHDRISHYHAPIEHDVHHSAPQHLEFDYPLHRFLFQHHPIVIDHGPLDLIIDHRPIDLVIDHGPIDLVVQHPDVQHPDVQHCCPPGAPIVRRLHPAVPDHDHRAAGFDRADDGADDRAHFDRAHFDRPHFAPEFGRPLDDFDHCGHHYNGASYQGQARYYDDDYPSYNDNSTTGHDH